MPSFLCRLTEMDQKPGDWEAVHSYVGSQSNNYRHPVQKVLSNHVYPALKTHRIITSQVSKK